MKESSLIRITVHAGSTRVAGGDLCQVVTNVLPFWLKFTPVHLQSVPTHPIPFFGLMPESLMIEVVA